jgi:hypothetical protein
MTELDSVEDFKITESYLDEKIKNIVISMNIN